MSQLKLNKTVGKNCYPEPTDVMIIQTCLKNITARTKFGTKPLWQGQIDGKSSRDLACAIENFQAIEGLKVTGKVEAFGGQTFSKLKQRTPSSVLNKLVSDPFMGNLPNDHIFNKCQSQLKSKIQSISSLPHNSVGNYLKEFWEILKSLGDPIAETALDIHFRRGLGAKTIHRLKYYLGDVYIKKFGLKKTDLFEIKLDAKTRQYIPSDAWRKAQDEWIEDQLRQIQVAVAVEHWNVASKDLKNIKGNLRADQIAIYHHNVFAKFELPPEAFGGTIVGGSPYDFPNIMLLPLWCLECDGEIERTIAKYLKN
jgi:hypothetical protein